MAKKSASLNELRHRVTIQSLTNTPDNQGGFSTSWTDLATVWGKLEPVSANERLFGERVEYQRSHKCVIRSRSDVVASMRITFDSRTFQIKGVRRVDEQRFFMLLDLEENQGT